MANDCMNDGTCTAAEFESSDATKCIILKSPDGTRWRITIDDSGVISTAEVV